MITLFIILELLSIYPAYMVLKYGMDGMIDMDLKDGRDRGVVYVLGLLSLIFNIIVLIYLSLKYLP